MDASQNRKNLCIILSSSELMISSPQSLELKPAHPRINDIVRNWCKVKFTEICIKTIPAVHFVLQLTVGNSVAL